ncbi:MAG: hypothetical protein WBX14_14195 [Candidatus Udaeobacter sp.]
MIRTVVFLALLQYLLGNWHRFAKFPSVTQLLELMNLFTNIGIVLSGSGT